LEIAAMTKLFAFCAVLAVTGLLALPTPADAKKRRADGLRNVEQVEVSARRYRRYHRHRYYGRRYWGPRYYAYARPYYYPYYRPYYYRPYYRPAVWPFPFFGFGFGW
jgi:hypothetical protein